MERDEVNAMPTKEFFIETLVKDISLGDCILDLIDNAIDGYIRNQYEDRRFININLDANHFQIADNCGGIAYREARDEVFRLGFMPATRNSRLSVYGIGLKRAVFKIGNNIVFESDDGNDYFKVMIDIERWRQPAEPWTFPVEHENTKGKRFTQINITNLNADVSRRFSLSSFVEDLIIKISQAYALYLQDRINISLNGTLIQAYIPRIAFTDEIKPTHKELNINGVNLKITAGITPQIELSGWYVFCNDRSVLLGDQTKLTGWGKGILPQFHPKHKSFVGFAYLYSDDPVKLPWNTTKTTLDTNSPIYEKLINEIETVTKPITSYLNRVYSQKQIPEDKPLFREVPSKPIQEITEEQKFSMTPIKRQKHITIQYKKPLEDIETIRKCVKKPGMPGTLQYDGYPCGCRQSGRFRTGAVD